MNLEQDVFEGDPGDTFADVVSFTGNGERFEFTPPILCRTDQQPDGAARMITSAGTGSNGETGLKISPYAKPKTYACTISLSIFKGEKSITLTRNITITVLAPKPIDAVSSSDFPVPTQANGSSLTPLTPGTLGNVTTSIVREIRAGENDENYPYTIGNIQASGFEFFNGCDDAHISLTVGSGGIRPGQLVTFGIDARYAVAGSTCKGKIPLVLWTGSYYGATSYEVHMIDVDITVLP
jgi:hypothetical protein